MPYEYKSQQLTDKQLKFGIEYIKDLNRIRAYKIAYPECKDSALDACASRLLRNAKLKEWIKTKMADSEQKGKIDRKILIDELRKTANATVERLTGGDKNKATELLLRIDGAFEKDNAQQSGVNVINISPDQQIEQLQAKIDRLKRLKSAPDAIVRS